MKFTISSDVISKFPEAIIGIIVAKNIDNKEEDQQIAQLLRNEESRIRDELQLENLAQNSFITNWRKVYKLFDVDKDRASQEALIRRVLKGDNVRHINNLVDVYNYISLKYKTPVGGEDLDKIEGNIYLKLANGDEKFVLLGSNEKTHPDKGEVVYADDKEVLCRRWNWRESEKTKLTDNTKKAFLVIEALPPLTEDVVRKAVNEFADLLKNFCNAETITFILSKTNTEISW
jgi:DNA/RNA-binding domain of Phe-tRNA-synthetase-like protein